MVKVGVSGVGHFSRSFIPLFQNHPLVEEVVLADLAPDHLAAMSQQFGVTETVPSHEALCSSDVDAIAIFTQRHVHGPMTLQALNAGKHVYCTVPIASSLDEIGEIIATVERTRLIYANGETSYYYPHTIYCRDRFAKGDFGDFVYGEGNYLHDVAQHRFYEAHRNSGGEDWPPVAGFPPMFYPTHSTSMVIGVTGARMTDVSCLGYVDSADDGVFGAGKNRWDNPFSCQSALMRTSDGGIARINEFRRVGWCGKFGRNPMTIYGTEACFEENSGGQFWTVRDELDVRDLTDLLHCPPGLTSKVHPVDRLPDEFKGLPNGHMGSHQFLVDDFLKAVVTRTLPPTNVWEAAKYCAPGLVAHQSSLNDGQVMEVPEFGNAPEDWELLDPSAAM